MDSQKFWARLQSVGGASIVTLYKGPHLLHQVTHATYLEPEHYMSSSKSQNWTWGCLVTAFLGLVGWFFRLASSFSPSTSFPFVELLTHLATKFIS